MKSKRPWKKFARIVRIELNNSDVKFKTKVWDARYDLNWATTKNQYLIDHQTFEDLDAAIGSLDAWWADWWPKQIKSTRRA